MPTASTRRRFLTSSLSAGGMMIVAGHVAESRGSTTRSANEKLNLAAVGVANKGGHNLDQLTSENIVALCDVDDSLMARAAEKFPGARKYRDYRKMLEAEANRIDGVVVSTADHTHAPATSVALDLGKHVYCEKPLTHTVAEARAIARLAKRKQVATQMGTQIHASDNYRRVVEWMGGDVIGSVGEVYTWCNKGWSNGRFAEGKHAVPENLDWNLWQGPAAVRDYSPNVHPANWRRFWDYGSGTFGDMACHIVDLPFWALGLRYPTSVTCEGPEVDPVGTPAWVKATYTFPRESGDLTLHWSDGNAHFDIVKNTLDHSGKPLSEWGLGVLFVGERGMLAADYGRRQLLPQEKFADFNPPQPSIPNSPGHWNEWVTACKTGSPTLCNFDYSGALTESVLLGTVAFRTGKTLNWDADQLAANGCPQADEFIHKSYRKGFEVVGLE